MTKLNVLQLLSKQLWDICDVESQKNIDRICVNRQDVEAMKNLALSNSIKAHNNVLKNDVGLISLELIMPRNLN